MWNESQAETCPMIVKKSVPRMRIVKPKEKIKVTTSNSKRLTTTCETTGNIMRLCVNLMPVLAAAKEPVEEGEDEREEASSCTSQKDPETSSRNDRSVSKSVEQTLNPDDSLTRFNLDTKQPPRFVLLPLTQPKPAPVSCDRQKNHTPLPPISLSEQTRTISSNCVVKGCGGDGLVSELLPDSRPWIDNPLSSKSRSAEFLLPDISLSSLNALLETVSQKLGKRRRGGDEAPWRRIRSDHLLTTVNQQPVREKSVGQQNSSCTEKRNLEDMFVCKTQTDISVHGHSVNRLPPLILTMTKKNLLTSNMLQ
ncbi:hypothetical protein L3Q82_025634 [Scortum barcoo]|uniref:Uncharacterized protein n=1 Tax=Scortum barcoo TaxID=214431 RepID=A0ACB8WLB5_9TELE|nr:hypothetical protein L3Q82_025634 [Scortum barcoo]